MATMALESPTETHGETHGNEGRITLAVCFALATVAHAAFGLGVHPSRSRPNQLPALEVELAPPPPPPPVAPPKEPPAPTSAPAPKSAPAPQPVTRPASTPAPAAARAGALLTAKSETAPSPHDEPVDFVTDPNGTSYGGGVVARGGTADFGVRGATAGGVGNVPAPPGKSLGDGIVPASDLSHAPRLTEADACRGFYPSGAGVDEGMATIAVVIKASGEVAEASVQSESPRGQGFGQAARTCLAGKHFAPAQDRSGQSVKARTSVRVRFSR